MAGRRKQKDAITRLRDWRVKPDRAQSLADFLPTYFKASVERPHKQFVGLAEAWEANVPPALLGHTRLLSLTRGVLRVGVDSSARLYELDRLLRDGLERSIITSAKKSAVRQVRLEVCDTFDAPDNVSRQSQRRN